MPVKPLVSVLLVGLFFLIGCRSPRDVLQSNQAAREPVETWVNTSSIKTDKIRVRPIVPDTVFKMELVQRVLRMGFRFDMNRSYRRNFITDIKSVENYYMRVKLVFTDTTAIISGEYGNVGLNGIAMGESATPDNIAWNDVRASTKGWETLTIIPKINTKSIIEYNLP